MMLSSLQSPAVFKSGFHRRNKLLFYFATTAGNQIRVVAFNVPQLTQALFFQKNQTLKNGFLISLTLR